MKQFPVSIFTFDELHTIVVRFTELVDPLKEDVFIKATLTPLNAQLDILAQVLGKSHNPQLTQLLAEKDHLRDSAFIALRDLAGASSYRLKTDVADAGLYLTKIFKDVGYTLHRDGYATQTSKLMILFNELGKDKAVVSLRTILGEEWLEELKLAHIDFENTNNSKIESGAGNDDYPKKTEIRKKIDFYMEGISSYIAINSENGSNEFKTVNEKIEEMVSEANRIARARKTRKKNANSDEPAEERPEVYNVLPEFNDISDTDE